MWAGGIQNLEPRTAHSTDSAVSIPGASRHDVRTTELTLTVVA